MAEDKEMACEGCRHTERTERERSNLMKRLRTIEGQIRGIEKMVVTAVLSLAAAWRPLPLLKRWR